MNEMRMFRLSKWAQELITELKYENERIRQDLKRSRNETIKQSEEIQDLLDVISNVRPDLYDRLNAGELIKVLINELNKNNKTPIS